jgi:hypothetical protein
MTIIKAKNSAPANKNKPEAFIKENIRKRTELIGCFEKITINAEAIIVKEKI